uniref:Secreted protein n=1 Tax=Timema douglasi TaxID=61478 RepID=A0A7R8Z868_TIMDO|nr:unnamed protein product [Timema douglasi]
MLAMLLKSVWCLFQNGAYSMEKERAGQAMCPYDPRHNSTAVFVEVLSSLNFDRNISITVRVLPPTSPITPLSLLSSVTEHQWHWEIREYRRGR